MTTLVNTVNIHFLGPVSHYIHIAYNLTTAGESKTLQINVIDLFDNKSVVFHSSSPVFGFIKVFLLIYFWYIFKSRFKPFSLYPRNHRLRSSGISIHE